jgi:hypothetical protein
MKAPICCAITQKTATDAITFVEATEFGQGEVAESPIAVPKVRSTKEIAAARKAPASTAPHSTKLAPCEEWAVGAGGIIGPGPTVVMTISPTSGLVEPQEAQDEQDDDDKAN